jgi:hypothetical protein
MHSWKRARRAGVDRFDQAVRHRVAQERRLELTGPTNIVDKAAGPSDQRGVFDTRHALSNIRLHARILSIAISDCPSARRSALSEAANRSMAPFISVGEKYSKGGGFKAATYVFGLCF